MTDPVSGESKLGYGRRHFLSSLWCLPVVFFDRGRIYYLVDLRGPLVNCSKRHVHIFCHRMPFV